ncbi:TetR/AcrR family transcriptional regulator [Geodermatophilus sabuli]|uniref:TetR/AcrR family transcriptional regulator n=1 Tax=Geodermatophilus sabuli TaxID=1564158 RepID=UPI0031F329E4
MPRTASPAVRAALVERAAEMLARREPVTLRALVEGAGASTMAVYTHFGGMPGLWSAVRQEGFTRLTARLATVPATDDPVRDLAALGAAYVANALAVPALYRAMFDTAADLEDPAAAAAPFAALVACAARAREGGRFAADSDPEAVATRLWAAGHGLTMLVLTGVLPAESLEGHAPAVAAALFVAAGDDPERAHRSVRAGWATGTPSR